MIIIIFTFIGYFAVVAAAVIDTINMRYLSIN
jgi:hypothetical protein